MSHEIPQGHKKLLENEGFPLKIVSEVCSKGINGEINGWLKFGLSTRSSRICKMKMEVKRIIGRTKHIDTKKKN